MEMQLNTGKWAVLLLLFTINFVSALWAMILYLANVAWFVGVMMFAIWLGIAGLIFSAFAVFEERK